MARLLLGDISWKEAKLQLYVPAEKVARLNTSYLPLPPQLYTSIEFFIQHVRPCLFLHNPAAEVTNKAGSFWRNAGGGALDPEDFTNQVWQAFNEFNPDLHITPINFRRMTVTALFASTYFS
jgi:hypothetical protein